MKRTLALAVLASLALAGCGTTHEPPPQTVMGTMKPYKIGGKTYKPEHDPNYDEVGIASWYGGKHHGRMTADGEIFDQNAPSAAHKTLPLPSIVEVKNLDNGKKIRVRVNDRGPFADGRILDLSKEAARQLGMLEAGLAKVRVRYVGPADRRVARR